jgi:hypothetical protein
MKVLDITATAINHGLMAARGAELSGVSGLIAE